MENKNYIYIYQSRIYSICFNSKNTTNNEIFDNIISKILAKYNNHEVILKNDKTLKIKISNKNNFNSLKTFLINLIKNINKQYKSNIIFNIDLNNYCVANIYTLYVIDDNNNEDMIKNKIDLFKDEFIKNIIIKVPEMTYEMIDKLVYSSMYNLHFHKLIFTIDLSLYEILIKLIYNDKYFNKNNISAIDTYDLYDFEYLNENYIFKEYLTICKNCKEYHKTFYQNDKNVKYKCDFICAKCDYKSDIETFKEHICNINKILDYCNLCRYYFKLTKKHIPNRGDCHHYTNLIKKFILENRSVAIKNISKTSIIETENQTILKKDVFVQTNIITMNDDNANVKDINDGQANEKNQVDALIDFIKNNKNILTYDKIDNNHKFIFNVSNKSSDQLSFSKALLNQIPKKNENYEINIIKEDNTVINLKF